MNAWRTGLLCIAGLASSACGSVAMQRCAGGAARVVSETLYFGTAKASGVVSAEQWAEFVDTVVTPLFPTGMTMWSAAGQWQSGDGQIIHELSHVLVLVHPDDAPSAAAVRTIVSKYRAGFQQEAVLQVRSTVCAWLATG